MKIAFVIPNAQQVPDQLYQNYVADASAALVSSGNAVTVFDWTEEGGELTGLPNEVSVIGVASPKDEHSQDLYLCPEQEMSDRILDRILDLSSESTFDIIELPLWGGLAYSLIRIKRLLGLFGHTKIVVNALSTSLFLDKNSSMELTGAFADEMEQYCCRYADLLITPFKGIADVLKQKYGCGKTVVYDWPSLKEQLSELEDDSHGNGSILRSLENSDPLGTQFVVGERLYQVEGRKAFNRGNRKVHLNVVMSFEGNEAFSKLMDSLPPLEQMSVSKIVYCEHSDVSIVEEYNLLNDPDIYKVSCGGIECSLKSILNAISEGYVLFLKQGLEYDAEYLKRALTALERNSDIAAVGCYCEGIDKYPFGQIQSLMALRNTCASYGNVFRLNKLQSIVKQYTDLCWRIDDWELLLALSERYQIIDVIPENGVSNRGGVTSPSSKDISQRQLRILEKFPRLWSSHAGKLVKLLIAEKEILIPSSDSGLDVNCPAIALKLPSVEFEKEIDRFERNELTEKPNEHDDSALSPMEFEEVKEQISDDVPEEGEVLVTDEPELSDDLPDHPSIPDDLEPTGSSMDSGPFDEVKDPSDENEPKLSLNRTVLEEDWNVIDSSDDEITPSADTEMTWESVEVDDPADAAEPSIVFRVEEENDSNESDNTAEEEVIELADESDENTLAGIEETVPFVISESNLEDDAGDASVEDPEDHFQVFWSEGDSFTEEDSVSQSYLRKETHALEIRIQSTDLIRKLRLDPSNCQGKLSLRRIEIWNADTHFPVFTSSEENAFDNLIPSGDLEVEGIEHDSLILNSNGNDPQLVIDLNESDAQHMILSIEFNFSRN